MFSEPESMIRLNERSMDDVLILEVGGRVDALTSPELDQKLLPTLKEGRKVLLGLGELEYISSAGLRVLLVAHKTAGKRLALCRLTEMVREVLQVSGFHSLFQIAETEAEGLEILGRIDSGE